MIDEKITLALSPFWLADLIEQFVNGYAKPVPFQLVYLVVPLVLRRESRVPLASCKNTSTIYSAFLETANKRSRVSALQLAVTNYSEHVRLAMLAYSARGHELDIMLVNMPVDRLRNDTTNSTVKEYFRAAYNLGVILSKEELAACFYKLGVFKV
ncbi:hypothetical protein V476_21840 [Pseudomonas syringae KCTC 12500]|uniref:three component ABC system middle component n=1 Tax=Pseudomonas syringae TaxID=317 RepID=UPI00046A71B5|nr:three component ABC system middle component [Pseudomonas syringae]KMY03623.1 hypothetical protein V476_21840 [Pseudomonas syringae KCTC 12500]POR85144.1 hypothetical protein BKM21_14070 [Pseudomonas syringae pv. syringae]